MRSFCIKLPLLTFFSLAALSCPKEVPARSSGLFNPSGSSTPSVLPKPSGSSAPARPITPADMLPARTFLPRTEITIILELY